MATALARLGRFAFRRRRTVLAAWLVLLVLAGGAALAFKGPTDNQFTIPGTESQQALDVLSAQLPTATEASADVVFAPPAGETVQDPKVQAAINDVLARAKAIPGAKVTPPSKTGIAAPDGTLVVARVTVDKPVDEVTPADRTALEATATQARADGVQVEFGGQLFGGGTPGVSATEGIGVVVAFLVLIVTFGSLAAAGMPLLTGIIGVGIGLGGLTALSGVITLSSTAPILALMLGLAVGIDYSLFIVSRHRAQLAAGMDLEASTARATGTAGSAVVFAGLTVIIALSGFAVVGIPFLTVMGLGAAATVAVTVGVALTLVPAMLGFAGDRLRPKPGSRAARRATGQTMGARWVGGVIRRPVVAVVVCVLALGVMAIPALSLQLGLPSAATAAPDSTQRKAYDLIAERVGPGVNGPLTVVVQTEAGSSAQAAAAALTKSLTGSQDVAAVQPSPALPGDTLAIVSVVPGSGPDTPATSELVQRIRSSVGPVEQSTRSQISVTGQTALGIDVSSSLSSALPVFILVVVGLALLLLGIVFRSIVVPIKAALGFLLTVGASLGAVVAVFQWGWLSSVFGVNATGPIISFLPVLMVGILFGLAMDYQVFLVSRMREDFVGGAEALAAVRSGFGAGARVVTAAALIMASVFSGFVLADDTIIKPIGFALALGVLLDAFVVRMTFVPAVMALFGTHAWWFPRWLDRIVPRLDIEGEALGEPGTSADKSVLDSASPTPGRHERDTSSDGESVGVGGHDHSG
ncbi:MAG: MMPL family transporter [Mycobacteriaceae bacterium]